MTDAAGEQTTGAGGAREGVDIGDAVAGAARYGGLQEHGNGDDRDCDIRGSGDRGDDDVHLPCVAGSRADGAVIQIAAGDDQAPGAASGDRLSRLAADGKAADAFRTIGEVAQALAIRPHVLRYWEDQFPMLRPVKRSGGRRYYRPTDIALIETIDRLVHREGYTLRGARQYLEAMSGRGRGARAGANAVLATGQPILVAPPAGAGDAGAGPGAAKPEGAPACAADEAGRAATDGPGRDVAAAKAAAIEDETLRDHLRDIRATLARALD